MNLISVVLTQMMEKAFNKNHVKKALIGVSAIERGINIISFKVNNIDINTGLQFDKKSLRE